MSTYTQGHTPSTLAAHGARTADDTCGFFTPLLQPQHRILDVGCGPGSITATLAPLVPEGSIVGIDAGSSVIEAAKARSDLPANCTFQTGNATQLPFPDETFDVVCTSQLLCHLSDPVAGMRDMRRVVKRGGFIACREADGESVIFWPEHPGLRLWKTEQPKIMALGGGTSHAGRELVAWALQAGFEREKVQFTAGPMTYSGKQGDVWWKTMANRQREDESWRANARKVESVGEKGIELMIEGWESLTRDPTAVFSLLCGQVVCYK